MTLLLQHQDHAHADEVLADLARVGQHPSGRSLVNALVASAAQVRIDRCEGVVPANAWLRPNGANGDWNLTYDPREWPNAASPDLESSVVLYRLLFHCAQRLQIDPASLA